MSRRFFYPSLPAGGQLFVATSGRFIRLLSATGGSAGGLNVRFPEQQGMASAFAMPLNPGTWFQLPAGERFSEFFIETPDALTDVEIIVADGVYGDDRLTLSGDILETSAVGGSLNEIADGAGPVSVGAGACVSIAAANAGRQTLFVRNTGGSALYLRSDNVTQESAIEVAGGQTAFVEITSEVFAYNPSGAAVDVQVSEIA